MDFFQEPPRLGNQYDGDLLLRSWLERTLPEPVRRAIVPPLREMGELAATTLLDLSFRGRRDEPELLPYDPWGRRVDEIRVPEAWRAFARVATEWGLVGIPHQRAHGAFSRIHQAALVHLFGPSSSIYTCPLAMSDGAATTLLAHGNGALVERAVPRLTSRDPAGAWTSGQWMTERTGGSDVGQSLTRAVRDGDGWRLSGNKWFTSATTSEMTLTLGRPEGNPGGGRGLALFYLELRRADGSPERGEGAPAQGEARDPDAPHRGGRAGRGGGHPGHRPVRWGAGDRTDAADHPDLERPLRRGLDAAGHRPGP